MPAECFPVGEFLRDEMAARGWSVEEMAIRMGGEQVENMIVLDLLIYVPDKSGDIDDATFAGIAKAFGQDEQTWRNLDNQYRQWKACK